MRGKEAKSMPEVSIIVPVYNKAEHLKRGVQSLLDQKLRDIEVILINDGSTDSSLEILTQFQAADERVILIDQANGGVSRASNAGLQAATGTFIGFMDPDDWVEPDMYRSMLRTARRTEAEVCLCNYFFERDARRDPVTLEGLPEILEVDQIRSELILNMLSADPRQPYKKEIMGSVFRLLIQKDYLVKRALPFRPGLAYMEDLVFTVSLLADAEKAAIDQGVHYHYRVQEGSASKKFIPGLFDALLEIMMLLEQSLKKAGIFEYSRSRLEHRMLFNAVRAIINEVHDENPASREEAIQEIRRIITSPQLLAVIPKLDQRFLPDFRRKALQHIQTGSADALYDYFKENRNTLDPVSDLKKTQV